MGEEGCAGGEHFDAPREIFGYRNILLDNMRTKWKVSESRGQIGGIVLDVVGYVGNLHEQLLIV